MKQAITSLLVAIAFFVSGQAMAAEKATDTITEPTAAQVLNFTDALAKTPTADRKVAAEALQKWMDGKLTNQEAAKYKDALKLPQKKASAGIKPMGSTEQCAACIAGCCAWWGCNPACIAGCVAGICK